MTNIQLAKSAGFCFGVKRACDAVYQALSEGKNLYLLGELIHNSRVMADIASKGGKTVESVSQIPPDGIAVIRAHGVPPSVIEELLDKQIPYIDMTCPFVKKIHNIVAEESKKDRKIIIYGKKEHPEVIGISGYCAQPIVTMDFEEIRDLIQPDDAVSVVAQTTVEKDKFYNFIKFLKKGCKLLSIFDTICSATNERQAEAETLAKKSDIMFVIGGKKSSNTIELYRKSKAVLENTYLIESAEELKALLAAQPQLKNILYTNFNVVGVTAGASTPAVSIEEVIAVMAEEKMMTSEFAEQLENYLASPVHINKRVTCTVEQITETEVRVSIPGYKGLGYIPADELTDDSSTKPADLVKIGDEINAIVIKPNDVEGTCLLSKKRVDSEQNMVAIKEAFDNQTILEGKVVSVIKGGLLVSVNSVRIFVPASQASLRYVQDLTSMQNTTVSLKIIDFDERRNRATGSIKVVLAAEQKAKEEAFWATAEEGKTYQGTVKSLTTFGAFVDIGGVDGLVHITELSWSRIKHPSEVVKVGQEIEVYIKALDTEKKKISLGFKKECDNPWNKFMDTVNLNDTITVKIVRIVPFGAFAEILPGVDGLIHISQIANKHIAKPEDELSLGMNVEVKVIEIDAEKKKVSLSMRELLAPSEQKDAQKEAVAEEVTEEAAEEVAEEATEEVAEEATEE